MVVRRGEGGVEREFARGRSEGKGEVRGVVVLFLFSFLLSWCSLLSLLGTFVDLLAFYLYYVRRIFWGRERKASVRKRGTGGSRRVGPLSFLAALFFPFARWLSRPMAFERPRSF